MKMKNEKGVTFEQAIGKLKDMFEEGDVLCSWAKDDVVELIINANYYNYKDLSWLNEYLDIQEYVFLKHHFFLSIVPKYIVEFLYIFY